MTKRFRLMEGDQQIDMAGVLMLLSGDKASSNNSSYVTNHSNRVFECKTCSRKFQSFQALGGHRASHKKPKANEDNKTDGSDNKPKVHECSVCGLEFAIGQALGGHMRRHRGDLHTLNHNNSHNNSSINREESSKGEDQKKKLWLDLNLPPEDDEDMECFRDYGINEIVENIHMVDCLH